MLCSGGYSCAEIAEKPYFKRFSEIEKITVILSKLRWTHEESGRKAEFVFPMEEIEPPVSGTEYRRELGLLSDEELLKDREGDIEDEGIPWNEAFPESEKGAEEDTAAEPVQREKANETETSEKDIAEKAREIPEDSESLEKSPVVRRIRFEDDTGSVSDGESTVNNAAAKEAAREPARSSETGRVTESISESEIEREALPETKNASESTVKKADVPANERANTKTNEAAVKSSTENVSKKNAMVEKKRRMYRKKLSKSQRKRRLSMRMLRTIRKRSVMFQLQAFRRKIRKTLE